MNTTTTLGAFIEGCQQSKTGEGAALPVFDYKVGKLMIRAHSLEEAIERAAYVQALEAKDSDAEHLRGELQEMARLVIRLRNGLKDCLEYGQLGPILRRETDKLIHGQ